MKKGIFVFVILAVLLLGASVLAETIILSEDIEGMVKDVAISKGIEREDIKGINQVDFTNLPDNIKLENIDQNNLALYEIKVGIEERPVYIITASESKLKRVAMKFANKMMLNFGHSGEISQSSYLMSSTGVLGDLDKGYVMMRKGSITGMSTNLEIIEGKGIIEVSIYKNGELMGFRNYFYVEDSEIKSDYRTISEGVLNFYPGDILSVYLDLNGDIRLRDVNTLIEISVD